MVRKGYVATPSKNVSRFSTATFKKGITGIKHNPMIDACFPVDGLKLEDCAGILQNANTSESQRNFINNTLLSPIQGEQQFCETLDDAELISFDPALQYGQEVDVVADGLNKFINEQIKSK